MGRFLKNRWTLAEEQMLVKLYSTQTCVQIATNLKRTVRSVQHKHWQLKTRGFSKPKQMRKRPVTIPSTVAALAYVAGIVDGEAHIGLTIQKPKVVSHNPHYRAILMVQCADRRMIDYLHLHCGGYLRPEIRKTKRHKTVYRWFLDGTDSIELLEAIYPYLVCKQDQVDVLIEFRKTFLIAYRKLPLSVMKFRHRCYRRLRDIHAGLSHKGLQFSMKQLKVAA